MFGWLTAISNIVNIVMGDIEVSGAAVIEFNPFNVTIRYIFVDKDLTCRGNGDSVGMIYRAEGKGEE